MQYYVDRELFLDSPGLTSLLSPIFGRFRGRTVYVHHANWLLDQAVKLADFVYGSRITLPFMKIEGLSRLLAEMVGDDSPGVGTSQVGMLEFERAPDPELVLELRFSLGAYGVHFLNVGRDLGKFLPLIVQDQDFFETWLAKRFPVRVGTQPLIRERPFLHTTPYPHLDWVSLAEVQVELQGLKNMDFRHQINFDRKLRDVGR